MSFYPNRNTRQGESQNSDYPSSPVLTVHRLHHHLKEKSIHFFKGGVMQVNVFETLVRSIPVPHPGKALKKILNREEAGATLITPHVSLPHARIEGIDTILAAIGIHPEGIQAGENKLHMFVLFLSPEKETRQHLNFLAGLSTLFQVDGLLSKMIHLTAPPDVLQLIRESESSL